MRSSTRRWTGWLTACAVLLLAADAGAELSGADPPERPEADSGAGPLWPTRTVVRCEVAAPGPDGRPALVEVPRGGKLVHPQRLADLVLAAGTDLPLCRDALAQCRSVPLPQPVAVERGDPWWVRALLVGAGVGLGAVVVALAR